MNIKDIRKDKSILTLKNVLPKDNYLKIQEQIKKTEVKDPMFINTRKNYANSKLFGYYEVVIDKVDTTLIEYDKKRIALPWQCNQDLGLFFLVIDELGEVLKPEPSKSPLPKPDKS